MLVDALFIRNRSTDARKIRLLAPKHSTETRSPERVSQLIRKPNEKGAIGEPVDPSRPGK
jgi:hypothetical protein